MLIETSIDACLVFSMMGFCALASSSASFFLRAKLTFLRHMMITHSVSTTEGTLLIQKREDHGINTEHQRLSELSTDVADQKKGATNRRQSCGFARRGLHPVFGTKLSVWDLLPAVVCGSFNPHTSNTIHSALCVGVVPTVGVRILFCSTVVCSPSRVWMFL